MGNISVCLYIDGNDPIDSGGLQERTGRVPGMLSLGRCMSLMHKWMDQLIWKETWLVFSLLNLSTGKVISAFHFYCGRGLHYKVRPSDVCSL